MTRLHKTAILLTAALMLLTAGLITIPQIVDAMPAAAQARLPRQLLGWGEPQSAALPAPARAAAVTLNPDNPALSIPGVEEAPVAVATPTATPSPTSTPEPTPAAGEAAIPPPTETPLPTPTPTPPPPPAARIENVTNIPQSFNNCGPANLAIVLGYWGNTTTQDQIAAYLKPNPNDRNVSPWQISDYVNEFTNLKSTIHAGGTLDILKRLIAAGFPPVIERGMDFNDGEGWYGHYLTLTAYDDATEQFTAMNTYAIPWKPGGEMYTYDDVWNAWKDFNYVFYVVYPPARQAEVFSIIGETLLTPWGMWENAVAIAQAQIAENPEDQFAWFNLGTAKTELGALSGQSRYYEEGAAAFDRARELGLPWRMLWYQFRPYLAYFRIGRLQDIVDLANATLETRGGRNVEETFYWLGNALSAQGDSVGAGNAYREALKVNENFYYAQWALDYLTRSE
jgi:tetratricopeptide (TPR) repeat protein